jgi:hypothetical protein
MSNDAWIRGERPYGATAQSKSADPVAALPAAPAPTYTPGEWFDARTLDEMQAFYMARLPSIREAAKEHGYAIGLHGSTRRDFDLMAMQWRDDASDKDTLAHAIAVAACGITRDGAFQWATKPSGRFAVSLPICWTDHANPDFDKPSMGHIDLSIIEQPAPAAAEGQAALLSVDEIAEVTGRICRYSSERIDFNTLRDEITAVLKSRPLARIAPDGVDARDAGRFAAAIARDDNAEALYAAVMNHAPDGAAIRAEFDKVIQETPHAQ